MGPQDVPEIVKSHFQGGQVVERLANKDAAALKQEICANRDKAIAAQRAQAASGVLPDEMNRTLRGFQESRVVLTADELDLFTAVGSGATVAEVAARVGGDARATEMLLNALVAMGWLAKQGAIFSNSPASARYFAADSADDSRTATLHLAHLWETWSTLTECVRAGTSVTRQAAAERGKDWTSAFIAAMHRNARARAPLVVSAVGTEGVSRMSSPSLKATSKTQVLQVALGRGRETCAPTNLGLDTTSFWYRPSATCWASMKTGIS